MSRLRRVAHHEAGHAVAAFVLGRRLLDACVFRDGHGLTVADREPDKARDRIMVAMAGNAAERLFVGRDDTLSDASDRTRIRALANEAGLDDFDLLWLKRRTRALLRDNRRAVRSVAAALLARRHLDGEALTRRILLHVRES
jgi:hypothetical protein